MTHHTQQEDRSVHATETAFPPAGTGTRGMRAGRSGHTGRTLLEMLAVLAIIGVLSITALVGFTYAMNKHRANETIYDVMLRGTNVPMIDEYYYDKASGYEFRFPGLVNNGRQGAYYPMTTKKDAGSSYYVEATGVTYRVCELILKMNPTDIDQIVVGNTVYQGDSDICGTTDGLAMKFCFGEDGTICDGTGQGGSSGSSSGSTSGGSGSGLGEECDPACNACEQCISGVCVSTCSACEVCNNGTCEECPKFCPEGTYIVNTDACGCVTCQTCPEKGICTGCTMDGYDENNCPACVERTIECGYCQEPNEDCTGCVQSSAPECQCPEGCGACEQCINGTCQFICGGDEVCGADGQCTHCASTINPGKTCSDGDPAYYITWCHEESLKSDSCGCCLSCPGEGVAYAYKHTPSGPNEPEQCCFGKVYHNRNDNNGTGEGTYICCEYGTEFYEYNLSNGDHLTLCCSSKPICPWGQEAPEEQGGDYCYHEDYKCCPEGTKGYKRSDLDRGGNNHEVSYACCAGTVSLSKSCNYGDPGCEGISGNTYKYYECSTGWID